ncbi:PEP-CTERM sorting domain-containing protein [Parerythrobacter jejuensis]|uniref:PEP-CTERM sorting domain-containing protein n=1 Tax=Parerythrobacter jejuensis TaxID=795812 RepID=A0A845AKZ3_9SPHN|nr:PEP-CTERM sorting domain-containing protein [Parerythrobacter jejuensis]MXP30284.1 PEP-CTERM sorting domain-containing protein [Parerythrobacter jejuensis]MXP33044.1 PEP-CTERM sorting domain-containing protein [Parerythrobacter jejuensis]
MDRILALTLLVLAAPASAQSGIAIPEPSNWALFGLGVLGVLIGRFGIRSRRRDDD